MKALIRLVHPHGSSPHWLLVPQPETEGEREQRKAWPDDIRFEAIDLNIISMAQDCVDWNASCLREAIKKG